MTYEARFWAQNVRLHFFLQRSLIEAYAKLGMEKRDQLEIFIKNLSEAE